MGALCHGCPKPCHCHRKPQKVLFQSERFFLDLLSYAQLLRIHFPETLQMKVLQTLMIDLLTLL